MTHAVAVPPGTVPPAPDGVKVNERGATPATPPTTPATPPYNATPENTPFFSAPTPDPKPDESKQEPGTVSELAQLLAALKTNEQSTQPTTPATQPAAPTNDVALQRLSDVPMAASLASILAAVPNLDLHRAVEKAIQYNDPSLIDINHIKEVAPAQAAQLQKVAEGIVSTVAETRTQNTAKVHQKFGGEDNWKAAAAFFGKNADPAMGQYVKGMLESGQAPIIEQATNIILDFVKQQGAHLAPGTFVQAGAGTAVVGAPLSKEEFKAELRKVSPNSRNFEEERAKLFARRAAGKAAGK